MDPFEREAAFVAVEKYYSVEDSETASLDLGDAVNDYLEDADPEKWPAELRVEVQSALPWSRKTKLALRDRVLACLIEHLDEECLCEDAEWTIQTPEMEAAAAVFIDDFLVEYPHKRYGVTGTEVIHTAAWVREFAKDLLDRADVQRALERLDSEQSRQSWQRDPEVVADNTPKVDR